MSESEKLFCVNHFGCGDYAEHEKGFCKSCRKPETASDFAGLVPVSERLPKDYGKHYLTYSPISGFDVSIRRRDRSWKYDYEITHWMSLPEMPNSSLEDL